MIARIWNGRTPLEKGDAYHTFLNERAVPDYSGVEGCLGVYILRRDSNDVAFLQTLTFWVSEEAILSFAGNEVLKAKYYPEDSEFLLEFEPNVQHFEVTEGVRLETA